MGFLTKVSVFHVNRVRSFGLLDQNLNVRQTTVCICVKMQLRHSQVHKDFEKYIPSFIIYCLLAYSLGEITVHLYSVYQVFFKIFLKSRINTQPNINCIQCIQLQIQPNINCIYSCRSAANNDVNSMLVRNVKALTGMEKIPHRIIESKSLLCYQLQRHL